MYKYAQILNNKVHWIMDHEADITELYKKYFSPEIVFIDITNITTQPAEGWDYVDGIFSEPVTTKTKDEILDELDALYDPQFDALTLAWATASMDNHTTTATARLADKTVLKAEYNIKREAILNG